MLTMDTMYEYRYSYYMCHDPVPTYFEPPTPEPKRDEPKRCRGKASGKSPRILITPPGYAFQITLLPKAEYRRAKAKRKAARAARRRSRR